MIIITYQDGTVRRLNPCDQSFYSATELPRVKGRSEVLTLENKLQQIGYEICKGMLHSPNVFTTVMYRGDKIVFSRRDGNSAPPIKEEEQLFKTEFRNLPLDKVNLKILKRELRNKHKREKFTTAHEIFTF